MIEPLQPTLPISDIETPEARPKMDFHQRNVEHLRSLSEQKAAKVKQLDEEQSKLKIARERLARKVLRRKGQPEVPPLHQSVVKEEDSDEGSDEEEAEEVESEEVEAKRATRREFRSRYISLLKNLAETNKLKQLREEQVKQKRAMTAQRLKEDLGLGSVNSKLFDPTVASLLSSGAVDDELLERKGLRGTGGSPKLKTRRREETKGENKPEDRERSKKAEKDIVKRAQDHLAYLAEKKAAELRKEEEERERKAKIIIAARESAKLMKASSLTDTMTATQEIPPPVIPPALETPKKKKLDERHMERLAKNPKRSHMPVITDMAVFRKKHKLSDKDKVFIICGGYPDIRKALKRRGNS